MVLVVPAAGSLLVAGPVGPGYEISVHNPVIGPIPIDDYCAVSIQDAAGHEAASGSSRVFGSSTGFVSIGVYDLVALFGALIFRDKQIAQGAAVTLVAQWFHADGTLTDTGTSAGWTYDSTTAAHALTSFFGQHQATSAALASFVSKLYQNAP